ncbi:MAG: hypothetical protein JOZ49_05210 [Mycolicibacterium sp.]|nr:hypothetical protein [Mycolicibacterium sp.]
MSTDPWGRSDREWIQTYRGRQFWPLQPRAEEVFLDDIAHALARQCRFSGHCLAFYSVAQHSILVSQCAPPGEDPLWGLLHDAAEAYLIDMARPVKHSPMLDGFRQVEDLVMAAICRRFGIAKTQPAWVKHADRVVLATEKRDVMAPPARPWTPGLEPLPEPIRPLGPLDAERAFHERFAELQHRSRANR